MTPDDRAARALPDWYCAVCEAANPPCDEDGCCLACGVDVSPLDSLREAVAHEIREAVDAERARVLRLVELCVEDAGGDEYIDSDKLRAAIESGADELT